MVEIDPRVRVIGVSGSLRAGSYNTAIVATAAESCRMDVFNGLGQLPLFNPDLELAGPPATVLELRRRIRQADAVLISSPEYAYDMSGAMKNALEWVVGGGELTGKPTLVVTASSVAGGDRAQARLIETLEVLGAVVLPRRLRIEHAGMKIANGRLIEPQALADLTEALGELAAATRRQALAGPRRF